MASHRLRVLAFARLEKPGGQKIIFDDISGRTLLGLQGMIDPPGGGCRHPHQPKGRYLG
jgi:hypothetical protein